MRRQVAGSCAQTRSFPLKLKLALRKTRTRRFKLYTDGRAIWSGAADLFDVAVPLAKNDITLHGWVYDPKTCAVTDYGENANQFRPVGEFYQSETPSAQK